MEKERDLDEKRTTMQISLTQEDKRFLKVYAAERNMTVAALIHECVERLRGEGKE